MATARSGPQVAVLQDGRILVAGGSTWASGEPESALRSAEIYDATADRWSSAGELASPRKGGVAVPLNDGSVLVLGGDAEVFQGDTPWCPEPFTTVERFYPGR